MEPVGESLHAYLCPLDLELVHQVIFEELAKGRMSPESKKNMLDITANLGKMGAEGIILGCTEISLVIKQEDILLPVFDTTYIHAASAIEKALIST